MNKFRRKKRHVFGQHFLKSAGVLEKIVRVIDPGPDDLIIEIGAGRGALTLPLAKKAGTVVAVEKDRRLIPALEEKAFPNVKVVAGDVLALDFRELVEAYGAGTKNAKLAGNLPYSISSPLLFKVIEEKEAFQKCVFLVQKEVAERICSGPGPKDYAPVSILIQLYFSAHLHFAVHPGSFSPPPKVESALISLDKRPSPLFPVFDERRFLRFLQDCFRQRRKTLSNNLAAAGQPLSFIEEAFEKIGLDRKVRPEHVSIAQFVGLHRFFRQQQKA
jgi:16S rRNA (adenine1518-N6/adenine1519-N6)-dimethyltransferase